MVGSNGRQAERSEAATARARDAALELFSTQGYGATSMRQISEKSGISVGNLYHHFGSKETIYQQLLDEYWEKLLDPEDELQQLFERADFPDDLEEMATLIERSVDAHAAYIMLIFIDVIEFRGQHIHAFYESMPARFAAVYEKNFARKRREGRLGDANALVAVMLATRWLFYYFTVEKCFGVPMHFGMAPREAVDEFIRILREGVLPRTNPAAVGAARAAQPEAEANLKGRRT
jgi:AcrR family transcriptional regulator